VTEPFYNFKKSRINKKEESQVALIKSYYYWISAHCFKNQKNNV